MTRPGLGAGPSENHYNEDADLEEPVDAVVDADGVVAGVDRVPGEGAHSRVHATAGRADVHHLEESGHVMTVHNPPRHVKTRHDGAQTVTTFYYTRPIPYREIPSSFLRCWQGGLRPR